MLRYIVVCAASAGSVASRRSGPGAVAAGAPMPKPVRGATSGKLRC